MTRFILLLRPNNPTTLYDILKSLRKIHAEACFSSGEKRRICTKSVVCRGSHWTIFEGTQLANMALVYYYRKRTPTGITGSVSWSSCFSPLCLSEGGQEVIISTITLFCFVFYFCQDRYCNHY